MSGEGRREELEERFNLVKKRIDEAAQDTPEELIEAWTKELDSISFELNNVYDDYTDH